MLVKDIATFGQSYTQDFQRIDVTLIIGQSNAYFCGFPAEWPADTLDPLVDISDGRVFQIDNASSSGTYGDIIAAPEPLKHPVPVVGAIGPAVAFARGMASPKTVLIPYAVSDTGFSDNRWNPGDDLFMGLCSSVGVVLAKFPNAVLRRALWVQGEKDALASWTKAQYNTAFGAFAAGLRDELDYDIPIIVSSMRPGWVAASSAQRQPVQDALAEMPTRVSKVGYADAYSPTVIGNSTGAVHYSASEARLMADRFRTAAQGL